MRTSLLYKYILLTICLMLFGWHTGYSQCPTSSTVVTKNVNCKGGSDGEITVTATGGTASSYGFRLFVDDPDNGLQLIDLVSGSTSNTHTFTGLKPSSEYLIRILPSGCTGYFTSYIKITEPANGVEINTTQQNIEACYGDNTGSITASARGGTSPYEFSINNGAFSSTNTFANLTAGSYTIQVKDAKGCTSSKTVEITQPAQLTASVISQTNPDCNGSTTGNINVSASGGTSDYTYAINGSLFGASSTFSGLTAGDYNIQVKDSKGCLFTLPTVTLTEPTLLTISLTSKTDVMGCNGDASGEIVTSAGGGTSPYTYSVNGGDFVSGTGTFSNLTAGEYTIQVKDANGCTTALAPVTITQPDQLTIGLVSKTDVAGCNGDATGSITVSASGGTATYEYAVNGEAFTASTTFANLTAGEYTIQARDSKGCIAILPTVTITQPSAVTASITALTNPACFGSSDGSIIISVSGGTAGYEYAVNGGDFVSGTGTFSNLKAGTYDIIVRDSNDCQVVIPTVTLTEPALLTISLTSKTDVMGCNGDASGEIVTSAGGGTSPYTYSVNGGDFVSGTGTFSNLTAGEYTIQVKDANGCTTALAPVTITQPDQLTIGLVSKTDVAGCNGDATGSITVSATGGTTGYTYSINNGTFAPSGIFNGLTAGSYTIKVRDAKNCEATLPAVTLSQPDALTITLSSTANVRCNGDKDGSITVSAGGGTAPYTYIVNGVAADSSNIFNDLAAGTYTIEVQDSKGCIAKLSPVTITEPAPLTINLSSSTDVATCNGDATGSITTTVNGGTTPYTYSVNGGDFVSGTGTFSNLTAGEYTIQVKDANGCTTALAPVTITQPDLLTISLVSKTDVTGCNGDATGSITTTVTGGTSPYTYSINSGNFVAGSGNFTGLKAGNYSIQVKDANGCTAVLPAVTLTEPAAVTITLVNKIDPSCNGEDNGSITVSATGGMAGYTYAINGGDFGNSATFNDLVAGTYNIQVKDANDCVATLSGVTLTAPAILAVTVSAKTEPACNGESTGSITVSGSGGTPGYTYALGNGSFGSDNTFGNLPAGTYSITIKDAQNCTATITGIEINQPAASLTATISATSDVTCNGGTNGSITVATSGGTSPYTYSVNGSDFTAGTGLFNGLDAKAYTIIVKDTNGCTFSLPIVTLTQPQALTLTISSQTDIDACAGTTSGSVTVTASGGTGSFTYAVDSGTFGASNTFTNLSAGNHIIQVKDANDCTQQVSVVINNNSSALTATFIKEDPKCNGGSDGSITVNQVSGGSGNYEYSIDGTTFQGSNIFSGLTAKAYTVTIQDINGSCTTTLSVTLDEPAAVTANAVSTNPDGCLNNNGSITVNANGGSGSYTYSINNGPFVAGNTFSDLAAGQYNIIVKDSKACTIALPTVNLTSSSTLTASLVNKKDVTCNGEDNGIIEIAASGGTSPYSYSLNGTDFTFNNTFSDLQAGTYNSITVKDDNGCIAVLPAVEILQPALLTVSLLSKTDPGCTDGGTITVAVSGGVSNYTYSVNNSSFAAGTGTFNNLTAGEYTIQVKDANGCTAALPVVSLNASASLVADITGTNPSSCSATDGTITISNVSGGNAPYSYSRDGVNFVSTNQFTGLSDGDYTITVRDAGGCQVVKTQSLKSTSGGITSVSVTASGETSCGVNNGFIRVFNVMGAPSPYQYVLDNGTPQSINFFFNLAPKTYTVKVIASNGCTYTTTATVTSPCAPVCSLTAFATIQNPSCNGAADGSLTVSANGGSNTYEYSLDGTIFQSNPTFAGLIAKNYSITVRDKADTTCTTTVSETLTAPAAITASVSTTNPSSCTGKDGVIEITDVEGGTAPYSYSLNGDPFVSTSLFTDLSDGTYTVTVKDDKGCTYTENVTLTSPTGITATATVTAVSCNGGKNGTITVDQVTGGSGDYTYSLSGGTVQASATFSDLSAGTYTVTVTDKTTACTTQVSVQVTQPQVLTISLVTKTDVTCNGTQTGSITVGAAGGTGSYMYSVDGLTFTAGNVLENLSAGIYDQITVQDQNGCTAILAAVTITEPAVLTISLASQTNNSCNGANDGVITVTASGGTIGSGYTYSINGEAPVSSGTFSNLPAGTYEVEVTDANGCIAEISNIIITSPAALDAIVSGSDPDGCNVNNGTITISSVNGGTAPYSYSIDGKNYQSDTTFVDLGNGNYTIIIKDAKDCFITRTYELTTPNSLTASATPVNETSCNAGNGQITVMANGGTAPYAYAIGTGAFGDSDVFTGLTAGSYTIRVKDNANCEYVINNVTLTSDCVLPCKLAATAETVNVTCNGEANGSITVNATDGTAPYSYAIGTETFSDKNVFTNLAAGSYIIKVRDVANCETEITVTITEPALLVATLDKDNPSSCTGKDGVIEITDVEGGTAPYSYSLNGDPFVSTSLFTDLSDGTYTVTVKDDKGCTYTENVTLTSPTGITATATVTAVSCNGGKNGTITVDQVTGGSGDYTYSLSGGTVQASATFSDLSAGTYTVTVTDKTTACTTQVSVQVTQPQVLTISLVTKTDVNCNGSQTGSITVGAAGGTGSYTYSVDGLTFTTANELQNLSAGIYDQITVQDQNGCTAILAAVTITEPAALQADISGTDPTSCTAKDGTITLSNITGGSGAYEYSIDGITFITTTTFNGLQSGNYTVIIRDENHKTCFITVSQSINSGSGVVATAATQETSCGTNDGKITISVTAGTAPYQYYILTGGVFTANPSGNEFSNLASGNYTVKVVAADNCEFILNNVNVAAGECAPVCDLTASISNQQNASCFGSNDGTATVNASGGTAPYTYSWNTSPVQTGTTATGLAAGNYTVTVTDAKGCIATVSAEITQPARLDAPAVSNNGPVCTGNTFTLTAGTITNATYNWTGPNGFTSNVQNPVITNATANHAGTYELTITVGGCTSSKASTTVTVNPAPEVTITAAGPLCASADAITLQASTAGGTWSGNGITNANTGTFDAKVAGVGSHTITYTVTMNGCTATATRDITVTATSAAPGVTSPVTYCEGMQAAALTANGTNLLWYTSATGGTGSTTAPVPSTTTAGTTTYYVSQTVSGCGESPRAAIDVVVKPAAAAECACNLTAFASSTPVSCAGDADGKAVAVVSEGGSGQYLYHLLNSTEPPKTLEKFFVEFQQQPKGPFEIEITDQNTGCKTVVSSIIGTDVTLIVPIERTNPSCAGNDGKIDFGAIAGGKGPYQISIDGGQTFYTSQTGDTTFANLAAGTYSVIISDAKPCKTAIQVVLEGNAPFAATFSASQPPTCNANGNIVIWPTGGIAPYFYSVNNGDFVTSDGSFELPAGKYNIAVKDASGCQVLISTTLSNTNTVVASEPTLQMPTCKGNTNGEITWNGASNEASTYLFSINNGLTWQDSRTFKGLGAGNYTITVKNSAGCTYPFTYTLTEPDGIAYQVNQLASSACGEATGKVEVTGITGGKAPYLYSLDGIKYQSSATFDKLPAGDYTMYVHDKTNTPCSLVQQPFTIDGVPAITYKVDSVSIGCEGGNRGRIAVYNIAGGIKPYQVSIDNGASWVFVQNDSVAFTNLAPSTYQLIVKYGASCQTSARAITISSGGIPFEVVATEATCGANNGSARAVMPDLARKYFYSLNNINFQESALFMDLKAGAYTMYVRESANDLCPRQADFVVPGPDSLKYDLAKLNCYDIRITNIRGGTAPYRVSLDGGKTFVGGNLFPQNPNLPFDLSDNLLPGEYTVVVMDAKDCATNPVRVKIDNKIVAKVKATLSLPDEPTGEIQVTDIRGGNAPYEVSLDGVNWGVVKDKTLPIDTTFRNQYMGRYTVYIRDANGCIKEYETEIKESKFTIPNVFTPNKDGVNDTFFIRNLPAGTFVTISNRWGKVIYSSNNYQNDWDGGEYPDGIYYFTVNIAAQGQFTGWVQIWR